MTLIPGVRGHLVSATFARTTLPAMAGAAPPPAPVVRALEEWSRRRESSLGPASSVRAIGDVAAIPLLKILGFEVQRRADRAHRTVLEAEASPTVSMPVVVVGWSEPLDSAWRELVRDGIRADMRWGICCNGAALRIVDAQHTWSRQFIEFDLALLADEDAPGRTLLWSLGRAESLAADPPLLDRAAELSARHGTAVCTALGNGVLEALTVLLQGLGSGRPQHRPDTVFEQSLTVVYRVLFLLFAEARGLVPMWHPVYRDRYTVDGIVAALLAGRRYGGVWNAIVAISRLAHAGCAAGDLRMTPFNGRLFSPLQATAFDRTRLDDDVMGRAVMAVGTASTPGGGRARIDYGDLDVEQLGAVYERVLEYEPGHSPAVLIRTRDARRSTGTFYTPRSVTAFLVRQTLEPLVRGRSAEEILRLRVLDPAMGSGAFLVAACRYLAEAAEDSLVREGHWHRGDITPQERTALRRTIAGRCLFGADLNPMAVQLARLSLWLATLASDMPLSFLDHHLVVGDSLIGAGLADVLRQPTGRQRGRRTHASLPLFADADILPVLEHAVRTRLRLAFEPDESPAAVSDKERTLAALQARDAPLGRLWRVLDLWCAGWFWEGDVPLTAAVFGDLCDHLLHGKATLPSRAAAPLVEYAAALAATYRFLHWPIAFPEVFSDDRGEPRPSPGFDAVIGNPPWDMVRGDSGDAVVRAHRRTIARRFVDFVRGAGIYRVEVRSHVNRYQLFVERALHLTRAGGRIGLILPSGVLTDTGAAPLRRHLFERVEIDSVTGLDNRGGLFAIHRGLRFVLLTCTAGSPTAAVSCRFGIARMEEAESDSRPPLVLGRPFIARVSGADDLGVPEIASERDLRIVEAISARVPWLGSADGWHARFGRELNATDDRGSFGSCGGDPAARPVLEGKQIEPFRAALRGCRYELRGSGAARIPRRARVAYRDIASSTNRLTLIAAVVPPRAVTIHTLFCLKTLLPLEAQCVLCGLLNSFAANYLIRLRVTTHVTASLVSRLPVPLPNRRSGAFARIARLARTLMNGHDPVETMPEYAEIQALAAHVYGLTRDDFEHILGTFPLISAEVRESALRALATLR